ncbi:hypothetical protein ACFL2H_03225 [Planctomycetota bacterium]
MSGRNGTMMPSHPFTPSRLTRRVLILFLMFAAHRSLFADDIRVQQTSAGFVPANAAIYSTSLQLDEQLARVTNSNAFARLKTHPLVQFGLAQAQGLWNAQSEAILPLLEDPANQQLLALLQDSASHEIFAYGNAEVADWLALLSNVGRRMNTIQLDMAIKAGGNVDEDEMMAEIVTELLDDVDFSTIPSSVIGFKTNMPDAANDQLARLKQFAIAMVENTDELSLLRGRIKTKTIHGQEFLTVTLDGQMIPWDKLKNDSDVPEEIAKKLENELSKATFTISIGVFRDYILIASGPDTSVIERLGSGDSLVTRKEFQPVVKAGSTGLISVSYVSADIMQQIGSVSGTIEQYATMGKSALQLAKDMDAETRTSLSRDIDELADDLISLQSEPGAIVSYGVMTDTGHEGFTYNWAERRLPAPTKQLEILEHVGNSPIFFYANQVPADPEAERIGGKWLRRAFYYADRLLRQELEKADDPEPLQKYKTALADLLPMANRLAVISEKKFEPAFNGSQSAFIIDAEARDDQWHAAQPPGDNLPMLEFALVQSVADGKMAREGFSDLFDLAEDVLDKVRELDETGSVPLTGIPQPNEDRLGNTAIYSYELPPVAQLSPSIRPNGVITDDVMVLSLMPETTRRLAEPSNLDVNAVFEGSTRHLVSVSYFNFTKLVDRMMEWVSFGAELNGAELEQFELFFDVARCFRGVSSETYIEGDASVTHYETRFTDLEN